MANSKDIITKEILKNIAKELSRYILNISIEGEIELIDKEFTRVEKREADILFKDKNQVIQIEIQNDNHPKMHKRMLRYYSDLLFDYEKYNIIQYVIYIGKNRLNMQTKIKRDSINYTYNIIDMKDLSCEKFLKSSEPSAISLAILCDFEGKDKQEVVNEILRNLKTHCEDSIEFQKHLKILEILSTNRNLENEVKKGEEMLVVDIEKMPSYNIGLERGIERGIEKGLEKGIEKASLEHAVLMVQEFNLDIKEVSKKMNISEEEIKKHLKKVK